MKRLIDECVLLNGRNPLHWVLRMISGNEDFKYMEGMI